MVEYYMRSVWDIPLSKNNGESLDNAIERISQWKIQKIKRFYIDLNIKEGNWEGYLYRQFGKLEGVVFRNTKSNKFVFIEFDTSRIYFIRSYQFFMPDDLDDCDSYYKEYKKVAVCSGSKLFNISTLSVYYNLSDYSELEKLVDDMDYIFSKISKDDIDSCNDKITYLSMIEYSLPLIALLALINIPFRLPEFIIPLSLLMPIPILELIKSMCKSKMKLE